MIVFHSGSKLMYFLGGMSIFARLLANNDKHWLMMVKKCFIPIRHVWVVDSRSGSQPKMAVIIAITNTIAMALSQLDMDYCFLSLSLSIVFRIDSC